MTADDDVVIRPITNLMRMRMPRELWDRWQDARSAAHHTKVAHAAALDRLKDIEREIGEVSQIEVTDGA